MEGMRPAKRIVGRPMSSRCCRTALPMRTRCGGEMGDTRNTHLVVAARATPRLLLDMHARPPRHAVLRVAARRDFPGARDDLHGVVVGGGVLELGFAFGSMAMSMGRARRAADDVVANVVVGVDARVAGELVRAREALLTAGEGAFEWLLAGVGANVSGLGETGRGVSREAR